MSYNILNFILFQLGWFACVLGAAKGRDWQGPAATAVILLVHLAATSERLREARLVGLSAALGPFLDFVLVRAGAYSYTGTASILWAPAWIIALWALLAATLRHSLGWLSGRYALAAVLGAVAGPLSYAAGARCGALTFGADLVFSSAAMAAGWAAAMPSLLWLEKRT